MFVGYTGERVQAAASRGSVFAVACVLMSMFEEAGRLFSVY